MSIRKIYSSVAVIVFILLVLCCNYYLTQKYNLNTVEFHLSNDITQQDLESIGEYQVGRIYTINYILRHNDSKIIMTLGKDNFMEDIPISKGYFGVEPNDTGIVIGDKIADKHFHSTDIIGSYFDILGSSYRIQGIKKNSIEIYIPFNPKLQDQGWQKKVIRYNINESKDFYMIVDAINNHLNSLGLDVIDIIIYKELVFRYNNLVLVIFIIYLLYLAHIISKRMVKSIINIKKEYLKTSRITYFKDYLYSNRISILHITIMLLTLSFLVIVIFKSILLIKIPPTAIPDNLFSLGSYIDVIKSNYEKYNLRLNTGIDNILMDSLTVNFVIILYPVMIFALWYFKKAKNVN